MFFLFPPLTHKDEDGKVSEISILDARDSEDGTTNIDFVRVSTPDANGGENLITHFGIQGRSDHLAEAMGRRGKKQAGDAPASAWCLRGTLMGVSFLLS